MTRLDAVTDQLSGLDSELSAILAGIAERVSQANGDLKNLQNLIWVADKLIGLRSSTMGIEVGIMTALQAYVRSQP